MLTAREASNLTNRNPDRMTQKELLAVESAIIDAAEAGKPSLLYCSRFIGNVLPQRMIDLLRDHGYVVIRHHPYKRRGAHLLHRLG